MVKRCMLALFVVSMMCSWSFAAEEYPMIWRFEKGLLIVFQQKFTIKRDLLLVEKETKQVQRTMEKGGQITLEFNIYWQVADVIDNQKAVVSYIYRNGKITIQQGTQTEICEVENPAHADKLKHPKFKPYLNQVRNGFVFVINFAGPRVGKVDKTWTLEEAPEGTKKKEKDQEFLDYVKKESPRKDPYQMESAFWELPNKMAKIGDKWTRKGIEEIRTFEQTFTLTKIEKHRGENTARADYVGTAVNINDGKLSGTHKGTLLYNLERRVLVYTDWNAVYENFYPYQQKPGEKQNRELVILERMTYTNELSLMKSNANKVK